MSVTPENTFDHVELVRHLLAASQGVIDASTKGALKRARIRRAMVR